MEAQRLSSSDIAMLLEALDAWVEKDLASNIMADVMGMALIGGDEVKQKEHRKEMATTRQKYEEDRRGRERQSVLLKAKLIQMEMDRTGAELFNEARNGGANNDTAKAS